jgi:hypothetical protein
VTVTHEDADRLRITRADFEHALLYDLKPAFGISEKQLDSYVYNGRPGPIVMWVWLACYFMQALSPGGLKFRRYLITGRWL